MLRSGGLGRTANDRGLIRRSLCSLALLEGRDAMLPSSLWHLCSIVVSTEQLNVTSRLDALQRDLQLVAVCPMRRALPAVPAQGHL